MVIEIYNSSVFNPLLIYITAFLITAIGLHYYRKIAINRNILSNPNHRTLHISPTPRGGGIVFASVFVFFAFILWLNSQAGNDILLITCIGGMVALLFGFVDDIKNLSAIGKFFLQIALAGWAVYWLDGGPLYSINWIPNILAILLTMFFLVWVMNAYNFVDGVDGIATSGAILSSIAIALTIVVTNGYIISAELLFLLFSTMLSFLIFNWPPAKIFMGDSGSVFLGYFFGCMVLYTTMRGEVSVWSWIIVFGYYISDTTITQITRLIMVRKWYFAHRSHAYQNFARITNSHLRTNLFFILYYLIWLLPLLIWSLLEPDNAEFISIIALCPALVFSYKFGPVLSAK